MSKTPRTDANRLTWDRNNEPGVSAEFAEGLELELNEANARINRLIEAGDRVASVPDKEWLLPSEIEAIIDDWHQAKESK